MDAQTTSEALGLSASKWGRREMKHTGKCKALDPKWKIYAVKTWPWNRKT